VTANENQTLYGAYEIPYTQDGSDYANSQPFETSVVPEGQSLLLLLSGVLGCVAMRRRSIHKV